MAAVTEENINGQAQHPGEDQHTSFDEMEAEAKLGIHT